MGPREEGGREEGGRGGKGEEGGRGGREEGGRGGKGEEGRERREGRGGKGEEGRSATTLNFCAHVDDWQSRIDELNSATVSKMSYVAALFPSLLPHCSTSPEQLCSFPHQWKMQNRSSSSSNHSRCLAQSPARVPRTCPFPAPSWSIGPHGSGTSQQTLWGARTYGIPKWTKLCHRNKRHAVCKIHKNTVLYWKHRNIMRKIHKCYAQNTQTLCAKCTNVMRKMHKRYAQNTQTLCSKCRNVMQCRNVMLKMQKH